MLETGPAWSSIRRISQIALRQAQGERKEHLLPFAVGLPVTASGGAGKLEHLYQAVTLGKASAVLAASVFHFGEISIPQAKRYLREKGIAVRI